MNWLDEKMKSERPGSKFFQGFFLVLFFGTLISLLVLAVLGIAALGFYVASKVGTIATIVYVVLTIALITGCITLLEPPRPSGPSHG